MEQHEKIWLAIIFGFVVIWIIVAYFWFLSQLPPLPVPPHYEQVRI